MEASGIRTLRLPDPIRACLFDMDGVLTDTARVHAAAWKETFDAYLSDRASRAGDDLRPFDLERDYEDYVDGKPRFEGAGSFLASRGIDLPAGSPADPPGTETVNGLANAKEEIFRRVIRERGVAPYPGSVRFVHAARDAGLRTAVVSSSAHCREVLEAAGIEDLFEARVDGTVLEREHLRGKPAPDAYLAAARLLGAAHQHAAVFEDALAGVEAGRAGRFGYVVGVDRSGHAEALREHGADVVVRDLAELVSSP
jgi:beta-phosphoglucomutase family hydrolase